MTDSLGGKPGELADVLSEERTSQPDNLHGDQDSLPKEADKLLSQEASKGSTGGGLWTGQTYRRSASKIQDVTCRVCAKTLKVQNYRAHLKSKHTEEKSMDLFRSFLSTDLNLFENIEMIIQVMSDVATSMSVESVGESWVSIYEAHSNKHRPISNDRAEREVCVAVNGPLLQHADPVIRAALKVMDQDSKDMRNRGGKFVRRNNNIQDYTVSKSVDAFVNKPKSKPFMS